MATKATAKKTRVTKAQVIAHRTKATRDTSPKWDGCEDWDADRFTKHFRVAMEYYRLESSSKELKPKVLEWMKLQDFSTDDIKAFKATKDSRCSGTMGGIAACLLRGMPEVHEGFNNGKDTGAWLRDQIHRAIKEGKDDEEDEADETVKVEVKVQVYVPTIQDRLRDAAGQMTEEIDYAIDEWIMNPDAFDPKAFKVVSLLRGKGAKAAHVRMIKGFFERQLAEFEELQSKDCDEQLAEGYANHSKKNIKKMYEFLQSVMSACDQIVGEAKLNKKPRLKKVKPAEDLVKKVKFKATDDKLGVTSVPPAQLVGAQGAVVYNTKTRKIGLYVSLNSSGLEVKGTTIGNFTDKSTQKTLRKPEIQLRDFKEQNTNKRVETWYKNIKSTEIKLNGRLNEDTMILKVFK